MASHRDSNKSKRRRERTTIVKPLWEGKTKFTLQQILRLTASEPLTLEEEHSNQVSWRESGDKLTFIICLPLFGRGSNAAPGAATAGDADNAAGDRTTPSGTAGGVEVRFGDETVATAQREVKRESAEAPEATATISAATGELKAGSNDSSSHMVGDVNLFLHHYVACSSDAEDDVDAATHTPIPPLAASPNKNLGWQRRQRRKLRHKVTGEVDIVIASPHHRGKGLGKAAVCAFLKYVSRSRTGILIEYSHYLSRCEGCYYAGNTKGDIVGGGGGGAKSGNNLDSTNYVDDDDDCDNEETGAELTELVAKIHETNTASQALFKSLGFEQRGDANYFGELEMVRNDVSRDGLELLGNGVYNELKYVRS